MKGLALLRLALIVALAAATRPVSAKRLLPSVKPPSTRLTASLTGIAEGQGKGDPQGVGTALVTLYPSTLEVCYRLTVSGIKLPALAADIHVGQAGVHGPVVIPLGAPSSGRRFTGCRVCIKKSLIQAIAAHPSNYYVNIRTVRFPSGAIRGQLLLKPHVPGIGGQPSGGCSP